jgi:hypothetical protein
MPGFFTAAIPDESDAMNRREHGRNLGGEESMSESNKKNSSRILAMLLMVVALCYVIYSFTRQIEPLHARRDAINNRLKEVASAVLLYHSKHNEFPVSLESAGIARSEFDINYTKMDKAFCVSSGIVHYESDGSRYRLACNSDLELFSIPVDSGE